MKSTRSNRIFFSLLLGAFACVVLLWIGEKSHAPVALNPADIQPADESPVSFFNGFLSSSLAVLTLQIALAILLARGVGYVIGKLGQPAMVGEILAGILLGPSFLGTFFPEIFSGIFPPGSVDNLQILSRFGLIFFMFIIGMELDVRVLSSKGRAAMVISYSGIVCSFLAGILLAWIIYPDVAPIGVSFPGFATFLSVSLSISAFALLSRMAQERMLTKTPFGNLVLSAAAIDGITIWSLFALVILFVKAGNLNEVVTPLVLGGIYVATMLYAVRPVLKKVGSVYSSREIFNKKIVGTVFLVLLLSTYAAEVIGIHAFFGAFLAGLIMPQNLTFKKIIIDKIEDISFVLFLPLFYVFVGFSTDLHIFTDGTLVGICALVITVAVIGKFSGGLLASRLFQYSWKDALSLGVLMNTRGLMTLIVISVGLELGILGPAVFTMLVFMTLFSIMIPGAALNLIDKKFDKKDFGTEVLARIKTTFNILVSFGAPKMGSTLLRLADQLTLNHNRQIDITALHITPSSDVKPYEALLYEKEGFQPIRSTAQLLGLKIKTIYRSTEDVDKEIVYTVAQGTYDLVLVGAARPVFNKRVAGGTGGRLRQLLEEGQTNVGVLIDRGFVVAESILLLLGSESDRALLQYAFRFRTSNRARVTILKMGDGQTVDLNSTNGPYHEIAANFKEVIEQRIPDKQLLSHFNLILVSLEHWNEINEMRASWIKDCPSIFVIKHFQDLPQDLTPESVMQRND